MLALVLFAALVAAYGSALSGEFLWDDDSHVAANPTIIGPLGLKEIWTTAAANYFPLVLTNFWLQHAAWGLNPVGYHVVTLAFHLGAAFLVWRVLGQLRVRGAWLGAALWALHPVQVESVAWICELKNTQSAVFFLLAISLFLHWLESVGIAPLYAGDRAVKKVAVPIAKAEAPAAGPRAGSKPATLYALALVCGLLALLSKPSTVMLPVALVLCVWWLRGRLSWREARALAPFFLASAVAGGWAVWEQKFHSGALGPEWAQTWPERCIIAGRAVWFYLGKLAWPHPLSFIYSRWELDAGSVLDWLPFILGLAGLAALWRARAGRLRPLVFAVGYFVALLFPVLGFFSVYFFRYSFVSDHFQYLASIGPLALAGAVLSRLPRRTCIAIAAVLVVGLGALTANQTKVYQNNTVLWQTTVARTPDAVMAWQNLGDVLSWNKRYAESLAAYREAVRLRPNDASCRNSLGQAWLTSGEPVYAMSEFEQALRLKPDYALAHYNLGNVLRKFNRDEEALPHFQEAVRLQPEEPGVQNSLAIALSEAGRPGEAIPHFEIALRARPGAAATRESLARALNRHGYELMSAGRIAEAIANYRRAVEVLPTVAPLHAALAIALVNAHRAEEAVPSFQAALRLEPTAELHDNFAQVLLGLGRKREALEQLELAAQARRTPPR